jgi:AraC-like DNA-binding protein
MEFINIAFHTVSLLLALLAASLLLWVNQERKHSNRLLAFVLIIFSFQSLMQIFFFSRLILITPWLLRAFAPLTFLVSPLVFVYIRSILNDELKFKKQDWLLLIPAILAFINFIPYYLLPSYEKINYLNKNFYNHVGIQDSGEGFLPNILYYLIRIVWSGIFIVSGFRLIYHFRKRNSKELLSKNKILLHWLLTFNSLITVVFIVAILKIFIPTIKNTQITIADIILGATILYICLKLFMCPQLLYGVFQPLPKMNNSNEIISNQNIAIGHTLSMLVLNDDFSNSSIVEKDPLNIELTQQFKYKNLIETNFRIEKPFLLVDYSLNQLANDIHIPRHILSAFINREYGMGFREFLNHQRVEFMIANIDKPEWKKFTLEAIAKECGYNSRITFIKNFKEITGKTPSEFLKTTRKQSHIQDKRPV